MIRQMMERSSKFLSLSGLSGVFAGCTALAGAAFVYWGILKEGNLNYIEYLNSLDQAATGEIRIQLLQVAIAILIVALSGAFYFSARKAKKTGQKFWSKTSRQLIIHLFIPLIAGGLFSLILFLQNNIQLLAPITLIFYGLALVNAGKFTFGEIHYLGLSEIVLGLIAGVFINHGLLFWTLGFGVLHIAYGLAVYLKYERI